MNQNKKRVNENSQIRREDYDAVVQPFMFEGVFTRASPSVLATRRYLQVPHNYVAPPADTAPRYDFRPVMFVPISKRGKRVTRKMTRKVVLSRSRRRRISFQTAQ